MAYQVLLEAHGLIKQSKGNITATDLAYVSGLLQALITTFKDIEEPEPKKTKLFG